MAGNNSIQFLRGNNIANSDEVLIPGQPAYDMNTGYLYVGNSSSIANTSPIKASYANTAGGLSTGNITISGSRINAGNNPYGSFEVGSAQAVLEFNPYVINAVFNGSDDNKISLSSSSINIATLNEGTSSGKCNSFTKIGASSMGAMINFCCNLPTSSSNSYLRIGNYDSYSEVHTNGTLYINGSNIQCNATQGMNVRIGSNTINFPTKSGTIALTSDISGASPTVTQNSDGTVDVTFN